MNVPEDLRYTKDHEWVRIDGNVAVVGITDFAQSELGDIVYVDVDVDTVGDTLEAEDTFGSVEAVKTVSDLYMPLAGTVKELNEAIEENPEIVNEDPYGKGWMIKISEFSMEAYEDLLTAAQYLEEINAGA
jgi:glycine cleavage system H protein